MNRQEFVKFLDVAINRRVDENNASPEDNFKRIAVRWTAHLKNMGIDVELTPRDVAIMMVDLKLARIESGYAEEDSWLDTAGYAACGAEMLDGKK